MNTILLSQNPYRILGVYSNSPKKDVLSNLNKMKAFLKVGKAVSFPLDMPQFLPSIERDEAIVSSAQTSIELPMDQIRHSLFWFMKATPLDEIALNHLLSGNMAQAKEIWNKKETVSSLLNLMACALIDDDSDSLAIKADTLFQNYSKDFCLAVNETIKLTSSQLTELFIELIKQDGTFELARLMQVSGTSVEWRKIIGGCLLKPIIDEISLAISEAKSAKGSSANYRAGEKLMNSTKGVLSQLRNLLGLSDMQYQMIADKLATTILQCGIDYFNDSDEDNVAHKAMVLHKYALEIAVGQLTKERCQENYDIIKKTIANLPPKEVITEAKAVLKELEKFCTLPEKTKHAIELLNNTKYNLQSIKLKLGASNAFYLKLSTQVVGNALHNIIEEVNDAQNYEPYDPYNDKDFQDDFFTQFGMQMTDTFLGSIQRQRENQLAKIKHVKSALTEAWKAVRLMDKYDMEQKFRDNRYIPNRKSLFKLCNQLNIKTKTQKEKLEPWLFALIPFVFIELIVFIIASNNCRHEEDVWLSLLIPLIPFPIPVILGTFYVCGWLGKQIWKIVGKDEDMYDMI